MEMEVDMTLRSIAFQRRTQEPTETAFLGLSILDSHYDCIELNLRRLQVYHYPIRPNEAHLVYTYLSVLYVVYIDYMNTIILKPTESSTPLSGIVAEVISQEILLLDEPTKCAPDCGIDLPPLDHRELLRLGFRVHALTDGSVVEYPIIAQLDHLLTRAGKGFRRITPLNARKFAYQDVLML
jgi:hypothetical protein